MTAIYNEIEPYASEWLSNLIDAGVVARGQVLTQSIEELTPEDLHDATQAHFFAGIGTWSHALRLAGVPDCFPVWTGSCPCQPFSSAGRGRAADDARHLWPAWFPLIEKCRPSLIFGEQSASRLGRSWFDAVSADLESLDYAVAAVDLCAAGTGAPYIRQRLYWVAYADGGQRDGLTGGQRRKRNGQAPGREQGNGEPQRSSEASRMAYMQSERPQGRDGDEGKRRAEQSQRHGDVSGMGDTDMQRREGIDLRIQQGRPQQAGAQTTGAGTPDGMGDADNPGLAGREGVRGDDGEERQALERTGGQSGPTRGFWSDAEWLPCSDGKARPAKPGAFPLVAGYPGRVARIRAIGNTIVPQVAAAFVRSALEAIGT